MGRVVTIPYTPRPLQREIHSSLKRFSVIVCHRRFGKTVLAINELVKGALLCAERAPRLAYIAPLYKQAKSVAWDYLKHYTHSVPGRVFNESELRVDFPSGARIQLFGGDSPDSLRGLYLDMVVMDEYAQMSPRLWSEIIRPALSDRKGRALFIGTPQGHNQFYELYQYASQDPDWFTAVYRASETQILDEDELIAARREMAEEEYDQEFECSWAAAIRGAYYGKIIAELERKKQIGRVPYNTAVGVETWWDLGVGDSTVIWFVQRAGQEVHVIDHYEMTGEGMPHYAKVLQEKEYVYSRHIAPHDISVRELGTGLSRKETAESLGIRFEVAPKLSVEDGIDSARSLLPRCWFDAENCKRGLEALRQYRSVYDDKLKAFRKVPLHDWTSHSADAFRYGAVSPQRSNSVVNIKLPNVSNDWMGA